MLIQPLQKSLTSDFSIAGYELVTFPPVSVVPQMGHVPMTPTQYLF